jgi:PTS system fructose-specific IIA component
MQDGFAIPHCKSTAVKDAAVYVVKFAGDVAWEALDGNPIRIAVALFAPDGDVHLTLLSLVATMLMDAKFREKVQEANDPQAIADIFNAAL